VPVDRSNDRHRATIGRQNHLVDRIEQSALFALAVLWNRLKVEAGTEPVAFSVRIAARTESSC